MASAKNGGITAAAAANGVRLGYSTNAAGAMTLRNNRIVNNGDSGIWVENAATGVVIEHNLIRYNSAGGIGGGVQIEGGAAATLPFNTIADNSAPSADGVNIGAGATVTLQENIFANSPGADSVIDGTAAVAEGYNLTLDGSLTGTGDHSGDPLFTDGWYLSTTALQGSASPALDSSILGTLPTYLSDLGTPTTTTDGTVDGSSADVLDLGYHHAAAAPAVDAAQSTLSAAQTTIAIGGNTTVTVEPRDSGGILLGPGLDVAINSDGGSVSEVIDLGDGRYRATYTYTSGSGVSATVSTAANGVALDSTVTIKGWICKAIIVGLRRLSTTYVLIDNNCPRYSRPNLTEK